MVLTKTKKWERKKRVNPMEQDIRQTFRILLNSKMRNTKLDRNVAVQAVLNQIEANESKTLTRLLEKYPDQQPDQIINIARKYLENSVPISAMKRKVNPEDQTVTTTATTTTTSAVPSQIGLFGNQSSGLNLQPTPDSDSVRKKMSIDNLLN